MRSGTGQRACTVSLRKLKAFGIVVRLDQEPALRVCLVSQTMLLSYSALFEVWAYGRVEGLVHSVNSTFCASSFKSLQSQQKKNGGSEVKSLPGLTPYTDSLIYDVHPSILFQQCHLCL